MSNLSKSAVLQKSLIDARRPEFSSKRPFWGRRILPACAYDIIISFWIANCILGTINFCLGNPILGQSAQIELTILIYLTRDFVLGGRVGGKYLLGLEITDIKSGSPPSITQSVIRNLVITGPLFFYLATVYLITPLLVGSYQSILVTVRVLVLTYLAIMAITESILITQNRGRRIGDFLAGTIVVQRS